MKKIIIIVLLVILAGELYIFVSGQNKSNNLKNEISKYEELVELKKREQEENDKKKFELELVKEGKKELIEKYEEVESWNKEIVNYLQ